MFKNLLLILVVAAAAYYGYCWFGPNISRFLAHPTEGEATPTPAAVAAPTSTPDHHGLKTDTLGHSPSLDAPKNL